MWGLTAPIRGLLEVLRSAWRHVRDAVHRITSVVHDHTSRAWSRHTSRVGSDRTYRRTLSTAVAALVSTLLPHPAVAAAVAVWVAEPPRPPLRPVPTGYGDDEDEQDDYEPPPSRTRTTLWDTFDQT